MPFIILGKKFLAFFDTLLMTLSFSTKRKKGNRKKESKVINVMILKMFMCICDETCVEHIAQQVITHPTYKDK